MESHFNIDGELAPFDNPCLKKDLRNLFVFYVNQITADCVSIDKAIEARSQVDLLTLAEHILGWFSDSQAEVNEMIQDHLFDGADYRAYYDTPPQLTLDKFLGRQPLTRQQLEASPFYTVQTEDLVQLDSEAVDLVAVAKQAAVGSFEAVPNIIEVPGQSAINIAA